jgi:hypothetical protein
MRHEIYDVRTQLSMINNQKMLKPNRSKYLNRPDIEMGDEDGDGDDEAGNSIRGFS